MFPAARASPAAARRERARRMTVCFALAADGARPDGLLCSCGATVYPSCRRADEARAVAATDGAKVGKPLPPSAPRRGPRGAAEQLAGPPSPPRQPMRIWARTTSSTSVELQTVRSPAAAKQLAFWLAELVAQMHNR